MHSIRTVAAAAVMIFATTGAMAQSADPAWLDKLSDQLAAEEDCAVEYYVNISEGELAGRKTFEARAQCRDGRQFDASRTEPEEKFAISECGVQVC